MYRENQILRIKNEHMQKLLYTRICSEKKHEQKPNKKIRQFHENVIGGRNITIHLQK